MCLWSREMRWGDASACNSWQAGERRGCSFTPYASGMRGGCRAGDPCQPHTARCGQGELWELIGGTL